MPPSLARHDRYLRRILIPRHKDLRNAGLLNPLDTPHHMRADNPAPYREGVIVKRPCPNGSYVNVGIYKVRGTLDPADVPQHSHVP